MFEYNRTHEHSPLAKYWASLLLFGASLKVQLVGKSFLFWHSYGNFVHNINKLNRCIQLYEESNIAIFGYQCSTSLITLNFGLQWNPDWILERGYTCTHHGPISICTSLGQLAFIFCFLCFLLSITSGNTVWRMLTFKHFQFIHCFNLPALHCDMTLYDIS